MKVNQFSKALALSAPLVGVATQDAEAAAYLKIDGIDGEAIDRDFEGYIKIDHFSMGVSRTGEGRNSTVEFKNPSITFKLDKSSPKLFLACANGQVFTDGHVILTQESGDGTQVQYFKIELENVFVSSYQTSGDADDRPTEEVTLNFQKVEWTYTVITPQGKPGEVVGSGLISKTSTGE